MTKLQTILLLIISAIFLFSFSCAYLLYRDVSQIDWEGVISLPIILLIAPAFVITFIYCAIIGKYNKAYHLLIVTNSIGLLIVLFFNFKYLYRKSNPDYKAQNEMTVESYRNFFSDGRDEWVSLAIDALEKKPYLKEGYGIHSMTVNERDTLVQNDSMRYFDVQLIYFLGDRFEEVSAYSNRYIVYESKKVTELYNKPLLGDSISIADAEKFNANTDSSIVLIDSLMDVKHEESLKEVKKTLKGSKIKTRN